MRSSFEDGKYSIVCSVLHLVAIATCVLRPDSCIGGLQSVIRSPLFCCPYSCIGRLQSVIRSPPLGHPYSCIGRLQSVIRSPLLCHPYSCIGRLQSCVLSFVVYQHFASNNLQNWHWECFRGHVQSESIKFENLLLQEKLLHQNVFAAIFFLISFQDWNLKILFCHEFQMKPFYVLIN